MSSDNFETGRLKQIFYSENKQELENFLQGLCVKHGITTKTYEDCTWQEVFQEEVVHNDYREPPKYMILENNGKHSVFEVLDYQSFDDHYHTKVKSEGDGEFTFSSSYYNGGASLEETLESEFETKGFFGPQEKKLSRPPIVFGETYLD